MKDCPHKDWAGGCWKPDGTRWCGEGCNCDCHRTKEQMIEEAKKDDFSWERFPNSAWGKPSKAVITADEHGVGCVLWTAGPHVACDIHNLGSALQDLGLDDAPRGISVWEGVTKGGGYDSYNGDYHDTWLEGTYRKPTPEEWLAISQDHCPWSNAEWMEYQEGPVSSEEVNLFAQLFVGRSR